MSDEKQNDEPRLSYGGLVRSIPRYILDIVRRFGSLRNVLVPHPRIVAKSAENISSVIDISDKFRSSVQITSQIENSLDSDKKGSRNFLKSKFRKYYVLAKHFFPQFAKSTIGGTIVFSAYDFSLSTFLRKLQSNRTGDGLDPIPHQDTNIYDEGDEMNNMIRQYVFKHSASLLAGFDTLGSTVAVGLFSGALGGFSSGLFSVSWDFLVNGINGVFTKKHGFFQGCKTPMVGTIISYSIVNSVLFSSYDVAKYLSRDNLITTRNDVNSYESDENMNVSKNSFYYQLLHDVLKISFCGFIAGASSEVMAHYTSPLEDATAKTSKNMSQLWRVIVSRPFPAVSGIVFSSLTTSLGFLAYEYGKLD